MSRIIGIRNRIRETRAFTLAETLVAVLIMLMVSVIVAAGIPAAARAYENVFIASNAEVLLSTTMSALRNELSTARDIEVISTTEGGSTEYTVSYYNQATASISRISRDTEAGSETPGNIMYERYAKGQSGDLLDDLYSEADTGGKTSFISESAMGDRLYVTFDSISGPDDGIVTVSGLKVCRRKSGKVQAERDEFSIRIISETLEDQE